MSPRAIFGHSKDIKIRNDMRDIRKFKVRVKTDVSGSECEDEILVPDNASDEFIEQEAKEAAMNMIEWNYEEVNE